MRDQGFGFRVEAVGRWLTGVKSFVFSRPAGKRVTRKVRVVHLVCVVHRLTAHLPRRRRRS